MEATVNDLCTAAKTVALMSSMEVKLDSKVFYFTENSLSLSASLSKAKAWEASIALPRQACKLIDARREFLA